MVDIYFDRKQKVAQNIAQKAQAAADWQDVGFRPCASQDSVNSFDLSSAAAAQRLPRLAENKRSYCRHGKSDICIRIYIYIYIYIYISATVPQGTQCVFQSPLSVLLRFFCVLKGPPPTSCIYSVRPDHVFVPPNHILASERTTFPTIPPSARIHRQFPLFSRLPGPYSGSHLP